MSVLSRNSGDVRWSDLKDQKGRFDVVVNLSGSRFLDPLVMWNESTRKEIRESRVGTAEILKEFVDSDDNIRRFVQITGVGVYPYSKPIHMMRLRKWIVWTTISFKILSSIGRARQRRQRIERL